MESGNVMKMYSLQRLAQMINNTQARDNESWKQSSVLSSSHALKDIGPEDRDVAVTWMAKLNAQFHFHYETFFLAATILDRFISSIKVQPKYLKCIALSCFYLASKLVEEEDMIPCTGELVKESGCGCRTCDVLRMERIILEKLSWNISSSTVLDYLHLFQVLAFSHFTDLSASLSLPQRMNKLARLLVRLFCRYALVRLPNAGVALALVSIELEALTNDPGKWIYVTGRLQSLSKVSTDDLMTCRERLLRCLPSPLKKQHASKPISFNRTPLTSSVNRTFSMESAAGQTSVSGGSGGGGTKRKAGSTSPRKLNELSKKPHPEEDSSDMIDVGMAAVEEITSCQRSPHTDAILVDDKRDREKEITELAALKRRLTYAEIVKCGRSGGCDGSFADISYASGSNRCCGFEASRVVISALSSPSGQPRIKT